MQNQIRPDAPERDMEWAAPLRVVYGAAGDSVCRRTLEDAVRVALDETVALFPASIYRREDGVLLARAWSDGGVDFTVEGREARRLEGLR
jgi:hypothetical protein